VWASVVAAAADIGAPALAGQVIPPLAVGAAVTVIGLLLIRRYGRTGVAVLGVTSLMLFVASAPYALPALAYPDSPVGFRHAAINLVGRVIAVTAAVAAWRASPAGARRLGIAAAGLLAAIVVVGVATAALAPSDSATPDDVSVEVRGVAFPPEVRVASGGSVFIDNTDPLRHTFNVEGTDIAQALPERSSVRVQVGLDPGTYRIYCAVSGHESMTGSLIVE
jgi:plastocyanin